MTDDVKFEVKNQIGYITLNRPDIGNAITNDAGDAIAEFWKQVKTDDDIRVVIITGSGDRHFCTGPMVQQLKDRESDRKLSVANRYCPHQHEIWKPIICVPNGMVAGGGLHFIVEADLVIAHEHVKFLDPHVSMGQVAALEPIGIARKTGIGPALRLSLLGREYRMPASEANTLGLVNQVTATYDEAMKAAEKMAVMMLKNSPVATARTKQAIWNYGDAVYKQAMQEGYALINKQRNHPDAGEGPTAFNEKRAPNWNPDPDAVRQR